MGKKSIVFGSELLLSSSFSATSHALPQLSVPDPKNSLFVLFDVSGISETFLRFRFSSFCLSFVIICTKLISLEFALERDI